MNRMTYRCKYDLDQNSIDEMCKQNALVNSLYTKKHSKWIIQIRRLNAVRKSEKQLFIESMSFSHIGWQIVRAIL